MRINPANLVLAAVGVLLGALAVLGLREATLSTHQPVSPGSTIEVVLDAQEKGSEPTQGLDELVETKLQMCRLEVTSDVVGEVEALGDGRYRAVLSPTLDQTNRRQFRGCLEDWGIDHVQLDVVSLAEPG
ncbi:MAG TPA: hypothetical protein VFP06_17195 [Acidimicrobiales bacterium]|nr:hypothetical protein [Acidimicrobiales bacterium]